MADSKLSMSLDQLIAQQQRREHKGKAKPGAKGPHKEGDNGNRKQGATGRRADRAGPGVSGRGRAPLQLQARGGITKGDRAPTVQRFTVSQDPRRAPRNVPGHQPAPGRWRHDLYNPSQPPARTNLDVPTTNRNKLVISGLSHEVSESDLLELFSTCGTVVEHEIHYDHSGRSDGTAHVVMERAVDAKSAFERYNGVMLDQQTIEVAITEGPNTFKLSSGIRVTKPPSGPAARKPAHGGPARAAPNRSGPAVRSRAVPKAAAARPVRGRGTPRAGGDADMMQE